MTERLYIMRDWMRSTHWRLVWGDVGTRLCVAAEGGCSAIYYRTMREGVGAGITRYGITPKYRRPWDARPFS